MIRVLIERRLKEGAEEALQEAMREMRREAIHQAGYISGETLRDASDPSRYVVICTWRSRADWEAWINSEARRKIGNQMTPFLVGGETTTILEPA